MALMSDIVARARKDLSDADAVRWSDADLLTYANEALAAARSLRPDLFASTLLTPQEPATLGEPFPLPMRYEGLIVFYTVGRAHMRDTEFAMNGKSAPLYQLFRAGFVQP